MFLHANWREGLAYAESLLKRGDWENGWPMYAEYAWGGIFDPIKEKVPEWDGDTLDKKRILILPVGGYGDNIMCFRWLGKLKEKGANVTYLCPSSLASLFSGHEWVDRLIPLEENENFNIVPEDFDCFSPLMALPMKLKGDIPWDGPYIVIEPECVIRGFGLCTKAGESLDSTKRRSLSRAQEMALRIAGFQWTNLNYGENASLDSWLDTAKVIACLKAVVTVDTGVMHLSGAMGKPTFVMVGHYADWKFGTSEVCPFYPTMKVFRGTIAPILEELRKLN